MNLKYFLYIDVLGFSELVRTDHKRVDDLYDVVASLHVHRHDGFRAIVFSDTILVYNSHQPASAHDRCNTVMYLCEFAKDLQIRLTERSIAFRALVTSGGFVHYTINKVPCFYGEALVKAYETEKQIQCTGLFIDRNCSKYNQVFHTEPYDKELSFVFLTQALESIEYGPHMLPLPARQLEETGDGPALASELLLLRWLNAQTHAGHPERVLAKYTRTLEYYRARYPKITAALSVSSFNPEVISPSCNWKKLLSRFPEDCSWIRNASDNVGQ